MSSPRAPLHRISAIVPTYNRADFLAETLGSILQQTYSPFEVIVVDDGSNDGTREVLEHFAGQIIHTRIENSGAPVARNVGAGLARGDWLWFCDSDDLWHPTYLSRVAALLDVSPQPQYVFGNFRLLRGIELETKTKFDTAPSDYWDGVHVAKRNGGAIAFSPLYENLLRFQPVFHSSLVVKKTLFELLDGYDERFARTGSEDFEFVLRCAQFTPAAFLEDALVFIRRHASNYSANQLHNLLGELDILRHAAASHEAALKAGPTINLEILKRSNEALEMAFAERDFALVRRLSDELGNDLRGFKQNVKALLSRFPPGLRALVLAIVGSQPASLSNQGR